jgi:hypothetical protein
VIQKLLPLLFVIRPETVSAALVVLSVLIWVQKKGEWLTWHKIFRDIASGILFGLSVYCSPRFLLFSGIYILLIDDTMKYNSVKFIRSLYLFGGFVLSILSYIILSKIPFEYVIFNIKFSAFLQHIGTGSVSALKSMEWSFVFIVMSSSLIFCLLPAMYRLKYLLMFLYFMIAVGVTIVSWGKYPYTQNCYVPVCLIGVIWSWAEQKMEWKDRTVNIMIIACAFVIIKFNYLTLEHANNAGTLKDVVAYRQYLINCLYKGDKVMVSSRHHPICTLDASYYAFPLPDSVNRTCIAISDYNSQLNFPECNYKNEITRNQPTIIDNSIIDYYITPSIHRREVSSFVDTKYKKMLTGVYILADRSVSTTEKPNGIIR